MKATSNQRAKAARAASLLGITNHSTNQPDRAEALPIDERHRPKKHEPGALKRGDSVWYRGERWWVECAPPDWSGTPHIRITDKAPPPPGKEPSNQRTTFYVHADCVDIAPVKGNRFEKQTTMAQEIRKERIRSGQRDIGDEVATLLRSAESVDACYTIAARFLRVPEDELRTRYGHLNHGQQRMLCGNLMRAHIKRLDRASRG